MMMFDKSGSVGKANYHNMLAAGDQLAADLLANKRNLVGAQSFSSSNRITHMNKMTNSYSYISNWIAKSHYTGGGTATHVAMRKAQQWLDRHGTKGFQKHLIIFSDGVPNSVAATNNEAARLKAKGYRISVVTITNSTSLVAQSHKWASKAKHLNLVNIKNFKMIASQAGRDQFARTMSRKFCQP